MDISFFGYKLNLEVLILIGVVYLIMAGHTFCGCCNFYKIMEGLETMSKDDEGKTKKDLTSQAAGAAVEAMKKVVPPPTKEGFVGANTNYGQSSSYDLNNFVPTDTSSWNKPDLVITPGQKISKGAEDILNRPQQPIPLPDGELLMFSNTEFKPECCPNTYSNGSGCACMTTGQYNYLINRGGNNVPYSEY